MIEWMAQAAPVREASAVKKLNDWSLLLSLNKITYYFQKNGQLEVKSVKLLLMSKNKRNLTKNAEN